VDTLNEFQSTHLKAADDWLNGARQEFARALDGKASTAAGGADNTPIPPSTNAGVSCTFMHQGKFHSMPSHFEFPELKLQEAIRFGLCGQSVSDDGPTCVESFKGMSNNMLPTEELKDAFKLSWKRAFAFLADGVTFPFSPDPAEEQIDEACNNNIDCLKSRVLHCCAAGKNPVAELALSTLANWSSWSIVKKRGTASDTEKLPPLASRNTANGKQQASAKRKTQPLVFESATKKKTAHNESAAADLETRRISTVTVNDNNTNNFARAFGHMQMSAALGREAEEFSAQAQPRAEARRQETGDAGGNDRDLIFVDQGPAACTQMAPNHGQTSRTERQRFGSDLQGAVNNQNSNERSVGPQQNPVVDHVLFLAANIHKCSHWICCSGTALPCCVVQLSSALLASCQSAALQGQSKNSRTIL